MAEKRSLTDLDELRECKQILQKGQVCANILRERNKAISIAAKIQPQIQQKIETLRNRRLPLRQNLMSNFASDRPRIEDLCNRVVGKLSAETQQEIAKKERIQENFRKQRDQLKQDIKKLQEQGKSTRIKEGVLAHKRRQIHDTGKQIQRLKRVKILTIPIDVSTTDCVNTELQKIKQGTQKELQKLDGVIMKLGSDKELQIARAKATKLSSQFNEKCKQFEKFKLEVLKFPDLTQHRRI